MKLIHLFRITFLLSVVGVVVCGCDPDARHTLSKAVLSSASALQFEGAGAATQTITIYADAEWVADELPEWVTVSPAFGSGTMDVSVAVQDNLRDGALDHPRNATIIFRGGTLASRAPVVVHQGGDKYRDSHPYTVSELPALPDEAVVSLPKARVVAVTATGCMVSDADHTTHILLQPVADVRVGDWVSVKGSKLTDSRQMVYVRCDEVKVISHAQSVVRPAPHDITATLDGFSATVREWISVTGSLDGTTLTIDGATRSVSLTDPPAALGLGALSGHRVRVDGYFDGMAARTLRMVAAEVHDLGLVEVIYYSDDFEWLDPWSEASGAGRTVEHDGNGKAPQIYTAKDATGTTAADALTRRGYRLEQMPGNAIYLQRNYLKFGKTDYQAGITLPMMEEVPDHTVVQLSFDWAPMVGGTRKFDPVHLLVSVAQGEQVTTFAPIGHPLADTVDKLKWLHAELRLEGIRITKDTRITIKSDAWGEHKATAGKSIYRRWFIDNIKLTKAK